MKFSLLKSASLISVILLTTTACAQQSATDTIKNNVNQAPQNSASIQSTQATSSVSKAVDSQLRQLLSQAGIKTQITSIVPSKLPNMYQVNLAGQPPLHITKEGKYVI